MLNPNCSELVLRIEKYSQAEVLRILRERGIIPAMATDTPNESWFWRYLFADQENQNIPDYTYHASIGLVDRNIEAGQHNQHQLFLTMYRIREALKAALPGFDEDWQSNGGSTEFYQEWIEEGQPAFPDYQDEQSKRLRAEQYDFDLLIGNNENTRWAADLLEYTMKSWTDKAVTDNGLFYLYVDPDGKRAADGPRTLESQCGLIYNLISTSVHFPRSEKEPALAKRGIDALYKYFGNARKGFWYACAGNGKPFDETRDACGYAGIILAMATAAKVLLDDEYKAWALAAWHAARSLFRDEHGGLIWRISPKGQVPDTMRSQRPVMDTFAALLALAPLDATGGVKEDLADLRRFITARQMTPGQLPEWYDTGWQPLTEGECAGFDIGHAFTWAFLLSEWHRLSGEEAALTEARAFLDFGLACGYDGREGGVYTFADLNGNLVNRHYGWWQQAEAARALYRHAIRLGNEKYLLPLRKSLDFVHRYFIDHSYVGWYLDPLASPPDYGMGNAEKVDVPVVNLYLELMGP